MYRSYREIFGMHTLANDRTLLTIGQSISRVILLQFSKSSRDILSTFVFKELVFCDVIIPGRESQIHWQIPIDTTKLHTKSQVDSISITTLFCIWFVILKIKSSQLWYTWNFCPESMYISSPCFRLEMHIFKCKIHLQI